LCGVGGCTIAQAKINISYPEFLSWIRYRTKRGSFHTGMRVEQSIAMLSSLYANAHRKQGSDAFSPLDFMPHGDEPELSLDDAMKKWS